MKKFLYLISMPGIILSNLLVSAILQYVFDYGTKKNVSFLSLLEIVFISLFLVAIVCAMSIVAEYAKSSIIQNKTNNLRKEILSYIVYDTSKNNKEPDSEYLTNISTDCIMLEEKYFYPKFMIFECILIFILSSFYVITISPYMLISIFVCSLPLFIVPKLLGKKYNKANAELSNQNGNVSKEFTEALRGVKVIKEYHCESFISRKNFIQFNLLSKIMVKVKTIQEGADHITFFLSIIAYLMNQIVAIYFFSNGIISLGQAVALVQLTNTVVNPVRDIVKNYNAITSVQSLKNKLFSLSRNKIERTNKISYFEKCTIEDCSYSIENQKILDNIGIQIKHGDKILLVGKNGSGKSTLCKVIMGYLKADKMKVGIDGKEYDDINRVATYLDQEGYVFNLSIKDNILLGEEEDVEKLSSILAMVDLEKIIEQRGYDYLCGKNGENLSGGERQKIQLARALYRDKKMLILDESFSAIDVQSRRYIEEQLYRITDLTILEVSHQMTDEIQKYFKGSFAIENKKVNFYNTVALIN